MLERESILQCQREGIAAARLKGKKFGRSRIENSKDWDKIIKLWKEGKIISIDAMSGIYLANCCKAHELAIFKRFKTKITTINTTTYNLYKIHLRLQLIFELIYFSNAVNFGT